MLWYCSHNLPTYLLCVHLLLIWWGNTHIFLFQNEGVGENLSQLGGPAANDDDVWDDWKGKDVQMPMFVTYLKVKFLNIFFF